MVVLGVNDSTVGSRVTESVRSVVENEGLVSPHARACVAQQDVIFADSDRIASARSRSRNEVARQEGQHLPLIELLSAQQREIHFSATLTVRLRDNASSQECHLLLSFAVAERLERREIDRVTFHRKANPHLFCGKPVLVRSSVAGRRSNSRLRRRRRLARSFLC